MIPQRVHNFGTYFITSKTWQGLSIFQVDRNARFFLEKLYYYRTEEKYLLHEFVVVPDHFHLIITPREITIERAVQFVKGGFAHALRQTGRNTEVWQKGFTDHRIRDAEDYEQHRTYVRFNPVRRGLCVAAMDYPYSSAQRGCVLDSVPQGLKPLLISGQVRHG